VLVSPLVDTPPFVKDLDEEQLVLNIYPGFPKQSVTNEQDFDSIERMEPTH
jgi:hypothetical protein